MQSNLQEVLEAIKNGERVITTADIDLRNADLRSANLSDADLRNADLSGADLSGANLSGANLRSANLSGADLRIADLRNADLRNANLSDAILRGASLRNADLRSADLSGANLRNADLSDAILRGASLRSADLRSANLRSADLRNAILSGAKNIPDLIAAQLLICPPTGSFQAYKKLQEDCIALLEIPEDALRSSATTRKCRVSKAKVLKIWDKDGNELSAQFSCFDQEFLYKVGETVYPDGFDEDRWNECTNGIHFWMTKEEAENW